MSANGESSEPRRREGQNRRPAYYNRNSQGRGSTQRYTNPPDAECVSNNSAEDLTSSYQSHGAASNSRNFTASNFKSDNFRGPHKQQYSRSQYNPPTQPNYKNTPNYHNRGSRTNSSNNNNYFHRNPDTAREEYASEDVDQRGQIVGGRYIRRHQNQVHQNNSRVYNNQAASETHFHSDRTSHKDHNFPRNYHSGYSYSNKNSETYVRSKASQNQSSAKDYSDSAHNSSVPSRNYDKKFSNHSANKFQNRNSADSDVPRKSYNQNQSHDSHQSSDVGQESLATQRELLISRLTKGESECLVCCELIRVRDQTWHCLSCYHVFHLRCIKKWARSPAASIKDGGEWRCPACQSLNSSVPFNYYCFCGKHKNPDVNYHLTPHTCGEICDRLHPECPHHCKELCHPGPCPPCVILIQKACPCGKSVQTLPCNQGVETTCQSVCDKLLNCGVHRCRSLCHAAACIPCEETLLQKCHCGKCEREVTCTEETSSHSVYSCGSVCQRGLDCGNHACQAVCHPGTCQPCQRSVEKVKQCCCGRSSIGELVASGKAQERLTCLDPVPTCGAVCGKQLPCGPKDDPHLCRSVCHESDCPPCPLSTSLKCRCGAFTKEFPCAELCDAFVYLCEKRCNRRKDCGRHKCLNNCCVNIEHKCELVCNKKLSCGLHPCQETCHAGNCPTCWNVSFDELCCHCGETVLFPPIACGTKPPECNKPCLRSHPCGHDVRHTCHSDTTCPPCTHLTTKMCYGGHKQCGPVMCFLEGVSCGMPCQKPLPCGIHKCRLTCHATECQKEGEKCSQLCPVPRPSCGHPCNSPCHEGSPCPPDTPCKFQVTSSCPCGHRSETTTCHDSCKSYRLMSSQLLATKMQEIKEGQSVNLSDVLGTKKSKNSKLQCNEECALIERNKRLAVALQIQNPDLSASPGPPTYSEFLKEEARKSPQLVGDVYDKLCNLVQLAKQSKQKCRSHSFPAMNRDGRRVVHELAEFFGCETQSYDEEPKRNVVATAHKNRCWLPFTSIMSVVQRDLGIRKGPTPLIASQREPKGAPSTAAAPQKKKIDYFDYKE